MQEPRILPYDVCAPRNLGCALLEFLRSFVVPKSHFQQGAVEIRRYTIAATEAWSAPSDVNPGAILAILSASFLAPGILTVSANLVALQKLEDAL